MMRHELTSERKTADLNGVTRDVARVVCSCGGYTTVWFCDDVDAEDRATNDEMIETVIQRETADPDSPHGNA